MEVDLRPQAIDITLCTNIFCKNKCKRYQDNWKPNKYIQSYIKPSIQYEDGIEQSCEARMED